jgi:predicted ATPase
MHRKAGNGAAGLELVTEAAQIAERNQEHWCDAMLELERGDLLLLDGSEETRGEAELAFKHAVEIATEQGTKMLELRASVARARLCADHGERAFDMLSPIYGWFAQGFETPDLLEARGLLDELQ